MKELFQLMAVLGKLRKDENLQDDRLILYVHLDLTGYVQTVKSNRLITLFSFNNEAELISLLKEEIGQITFNKLSLEMKLDDLYDKQNH